MRGIVIALLPLFVYLKEVSTQSATCPCEEDDIEDALKGAYTTVLDVFVSTRQRALHCCKELLDDPDDFLNITWSYNGQAYPWKSNTNSSLEVNGHCPETLETKYATMSDAGNYTCAITTVNGTVIYRTYNIQVQASESLREKPILSFLSPNVLTLPGKNVTLTCRAYFGRASPLSLSDGFISWRRALDNGSLSFVSETMKGKTVTKNGMKTSILHLTELRPSDYGRYVCILENLYGNVFYNVSIIHGMTPHEYMAVTFRAWLLVIVFVFMLLVLMLCIWCRCRTILLLYYKENFAPLPSKGSYKWDVMVVHGDDASGWVWKSFVPCLEDTYGYSCFLPERDLCGGQMVAETVAEIVGQCCRVVLVVTKGLLESPMAVWALHQSVHAVLTTNAKMVAVIIEDITKVKTSSSNGLVGILKVVRKLQWPGPWLSEDDDEYGDEEVFEEADMMGKEKPKGKKAKGNKRKTKKMKNNNNNKKNINNQKVSNMVSAYNKKNHDDLEDLDKVCDGGKPLRPTRLYIDLHEQSSTSEPGSPDSQAPFIIPGVGGDQRNKVGFWALVKTGYTLDPIELFWQKLRLYLLRPNRARHIQGS